MKTREPVQVTIASLAGDGCGYSDDKKLAVYGALAGESVIAAPITRRRKRLYLRTTDVLEASPDRVEPACSVAGQCGGCTFQHLDHDRQLELKTRMLADQLAPMVPEVWMPPLVGPKLHYRSKARLGVKFVEKKGRVLVGFREKMKPFIAEAINCPVLTRPVSDLLTPMAEMIQSLSAARSIPQVELASGNETALIFRHLEALCDDDLVILKQFAASHHLRLYLQPAGPDSVHRLYPEAGEDLLSYRLPEFDLDFVFAPTDFTQVNLEVNRQMVQQAVGLLSLTGNDCVLDAFCGIGNFSLAVARSAGQVLGLEQAGESVARARVNAQQNGVENA